MGADTLLIILIVILIIVIMVRGPKTLPLIGGMLGRGVKEARKEASEFQKERDGTAGDQPAPPPDDRRRHRHHRRRRPPDRPEPGGAVDAGR